jgi:hypothetical protein
MKTSNLTNWDDFRRLFNEINFKYIFLKPEYDIEAAAKLFNDTIHCTGWNSTPEHKMTLKAYDSPIQIKKKKRLRTEWQ